jgi:hypothetical protein
MGAARYCRIGHGFLKSRKAAAKDFYQELAECLSAEVRQGRSLIFAAKPLERERHDAFARASVLIRGHGKV